MAPPEIWLSGPPPFPYFTLGSHPAGVAAAPGGWREGIAPAFVRGLGAPCGQGAEFFSLFWESSATLLSRVKTGRKGKMDLDPSALALWPGVQSPARCLDLP